MTAREVVLEGGSPWGFRMHGGVDQNQPLKISRVNPGSKAASRGIREGDLISSINGQRTKTLTNIEGHGLLRNAGEILKLGLNEDPGGSPKRRQYRTIHQETLQETVKKSSVTTYSLLKTVETIESQSEKDNDNSIETNGYSTINGASNSIPPSNLLITKKPSSSSSSSSTLTKEDLKTISSDNALASQRSSYTNCTLSPSSPSILSEDGICSSTPSQDNTNIQNMNDNQSSSRSKKRRQRRRNRKISNSQNNSDNDINNVPQEEYTVQSPVEIVEVKSKNKPTKPVKSRSLDDDEMVQIQEVNSEISESDDKEKETQAIVSEASESEVEWEEASDLNTPSPSLGSLSTITLPLEGYSSEQITLMSPEEEKTLRDFLEGLNLVSGPEEAASQVNDKNSPESIKQRKARKKVELEQYFLPIYQNPRYLDVISEENSDRDSDREQTKINLTRQLRKGTPEDNNPPKKTRKLPPTKFSAPIDQSPAVLVDAKIIETPIVSETIPTQSFITTGEEAKASTVEVVYLTSSETDSADESDSKSSDSYVIDSSYEDLSEKTVVNDKTDEITNTQAIGNTHKKDTDIPPCIYEDYKVKDAERLELLSELTPPLTPDNNSPKEDINIKDTSTKCHTPPPSRSSSSSESSSRGSSLCTAKYIPSISSLTDVISLAKEEESYFQPITLREICLRFLISMPFGKEILEEIADVSKYIESYTRSLPSTVLPKLVPNLATFGNKNNSHSNHLSNLSVKLSPKKLEEKKQVSTEKDYVIPEIINDRMSQNGSTKRQLDNPIQFTEKFNKETKLNEEKIESSTESLTERHETKTCFTVRKLSNSQSEEITIPTDTERNVPPVPPANADLKEIIIPIKIQETVVPKEVIIPVRQEISKSSKNITTTASNAVTQPLTGVREKSKEVIIPIKKEDITPPKEIIIPVQKEVPKPPVRSKVSKDSVSKSKEVIIPVRKEVREISQSDITKTVSTQKTTLVQAHGTKLNGREVKPKEVIIPITKEVTAITKSPKNVIDSPETKEVIIPITLEVKGSNNSVPPEKPKTKEFIVPITKEIPLPASLLTPPDDPKDVIMPITNKETGVRKIEHTKWTGMASGQDPNVLVCLSPKQKDQLEKSKAIPDEASKLIELHEKFVNRSIAHEESRKEYDARVQVTCINPESPRLLTIIKEEPSTSNDYIYFEEKDPRSSTLPRCSDTARLNAKDLSEWLNLARNKSMSESNLTTVPDYPENNLRNNFNMQPTAPRRRTSLPHDIFEKQMIYIQEKEREIQRQLEALEEEKRLLNAEMAPSRQFHAEDYYFSRKGDFAESKKRPISMPMMPTEYFRQQMYEEYMDKFQEREDRKQHKIIKVTSTKDINQESGKEIVHPIQLEDEFMTKVKELQKVGKLEKIKSQDKEVPSVETNNEEPPVLVMDREKLKEAKELPKHLQEFVGDDGTAKRRVELVVGRRPDADASPLRRSRGVARVLTREFIKDDIVKTCVSCCLDSNEINFILCCDDEMKDIKMIAPAPTFKATASPSSPSIWSPGQKIELSPKEEERKRFNFEQDESISPIWTPKSANSSPIAERKEFRSVNFQSPVLGRRNRTTSETSGSTSQVQAPPWKGSDYKKEKESASLISERRLPTSRSTPISGFSELSSTSRLPKAQNPTITLLQKAREGQLPKGASYIEETRQYKLKNERPPIATPGEVLYHIKNEYTSESDNEKPRKMTDLGPRKFEGVGPVSRDGLPLVLRSEVKDQNQSKWYKRMYDTIHKQKPQNDEYVTIRYKQKRAQYPYTSGYLSEPEPGAYDSDFTDYKYQTLDRRRPQPQDRSTEYISSTMPRPTVNRSFSSDIVKNTEEYYNTQPGRIENYTPGHSSISEKEAKQWWDEVMEIFDGHLEQQKRVQANSNPKSFINQALKESGYESDSTLVFRRREEAAQQLSPKEQREVYKVIQKGGDIPLHGLRKPAPEKPKEFVEFFPISPTLTRIRIHKNIKPQKEVICYPVTVHHDMENTFSAYKRTARSSAIPTPPPIPPPSPPRRKSSRNNPTLRLVSTMKVKSSKSPLCKRHETCFTTTSDIDRSKVNYLKDKITCKLSPNLNKRSTSPKIRVVKKVTTTPDLRNKITSTLTTTKDIKTSTRKVHSKTHIQNPISRSKSTEFSSKTSKTGYKKSPVNSSMESLNLMRSSPKTFASEKKKFELNIKPPAKLVKSPDLVSPTEVKKASMMNLPSGIIYKKSSVPLKSTKSKEFLPIKVGVSERGRTVLRTLSSSPKPKRASPSSSLSSTKGKSSLESLISPKLPKKKLSKSSIATTKPKKDTQKSKKEQINDKIKSNKKETKNTTIKKENGSSSILNDIRKQKEAIESNHFFQHLFLRDTSPIPSSNISRNSWIVERTNQLHRRRSSFPEPSISAMKVYLKHTKPVTDSKFISLDMAMIRSRSVSPTKSVTFDNNIKETKDVSTPKRSTSLPSKLIFSQTSRPVSPIITHKKLVSPPPSPKLCRSPSCRRIMQYKTAQLEKKPSEYTFYMCPSLNLSTTSLDSLKSDDYYKYFNEMVHTKKFKDLNQFYSEIEKVGQLEKVFSVKPRKKSETEIIDFDRWKEVRTRERAEQELGYLYDQIRKEEKDKGFLYMPKDVSRYRWKKERDIGLRIKEKSVDDIKEEFEKIKLEDSDRENARRRELAFLKDTYKPLWRGFSVSNIANSIGESRSQSEGRVKTVRQKLIDSDKLLTQRIGSRIWSSLSLEQVNLLKKQLAEIYNDIPKNKDDFLTKNKEEYSIHVPKDKIKSYVPTLTVRRNSDTTDQIYKPPTDTNLTESDKKMISYTLSKELLHKIAQQRKENKLALPIVVGKEVLGAVAAADANINKKEQPEKPLIKTTALTNLKLPTTSENESGSTDESTKSVINLGKDDIKKKVEYFELVKEPEPYIPTVHKPADTTAEENGDISPEASDTTIHQSKSCQSLKEYFGETELIKFATLPLSATRKQKFSPKKPELRAVDISPIRSELSSNDSLYRSRSISPYINQKPPVSPYINEKPQLSVKSGEVSRLRNKFEYLEDIYGSRTLKRSRSESDLNSVLPYCNLGHVDNLRRKYEYPAYSGRGRSRTRRGGVVSPMFLRAEDRFMPHINIISKIASLYTRSGTKNGNNKHKKSIEELAEILGCPVGEVERLKEKFDSEEDISLMGHMYTSSPSIRELKDIAPYLTADWTAHRYPRIEDNTRSLSSPEHSIASKDTSIVRKDRQRPKSTSPLPKSKKSQSILKPVQKSRSTDFFKNQKYDPKIHEPVARYQPNDVARYRNGWSVYSKPTVSFKEPEPPVPPPKGHSARILDQESPRKYVENDVTIHYKTPVRQEVKGYLSEDELAHRQAEAMKKIYQEERRKKYLQVSKSLQELQDMNSRRHTDNFIPSQKSPISLNRYDDFEDLAPNVRPRPRSPEHRLCARALYNFVGQSARELTFRKGDIIYLRRQIDKNWYEGELNAMVGLFPANYIEIIPFDGSKTKTTLRKAHEGQARAKYNFVAQTHLELSLAKGELVVVTRKIDDNWFEGKIGGRKGIFPSNYVEMLIDPQTSPAAPSKPVASPASHSLLLNGSSGGKESMGSHSYTPSLSSSYHAKPVHVLNNGGYNSLNHKNPALSQALHIETQSEPIPYRAMYKYKPQNEDELELLEGDTVYVLEKCDDGWFVGSSERTGAFGTFPGNYVEKI